MTAVPLPAPYVWTADICKTTLGCVCQATDTAYNVEVAIKVMNYSQLTQEEANALLYEARSLMYLNHDHVVKTYNVIVETESSTVYIIMEPCMGTLGTAVQVMSAFGRQIPEEHIWCIAAEIGSAFKYLHEPHEKIMVDWYGNEVPVGPVVHGYLTPSDILISRDGKCKVGGLSPTLSAWEIRSGKADLGRLFLQAPEILEMQPNITEKVDIWSLGTTLFFIAAFQSVWLSTDYTSIVNEMRAGKVQRLPEIYSPELDSFIGRCLQIDPMYRPSILELLLEPKVNDAMHSVCDGSVPSLCYILGVTTEAVPQSSAIQPDVIVAQDVPVELTAPAQDDPMNVVRLSTPLTGSVMVEPGAPESVELPALPIETPTTSTFDPQDMATYTQAAARAMPSESIPPTSDFVDSAEKIVNLIAKEACIPPPPAEDAREPVDMSALPASVTESIQPIPDPIPDGSMNQAAVMANYPAESYNSTYSVPIEDVQKLPDPEDSDLGVVYTLPQQAQVPEQSLVESVKKLDEPAAEYDEPVESVYSTNPNAFATQEPESPVTDVVDVLQTPASESSVYVVAPVPSAGPVQSKIYAGPASYSSSTIVHPVEGVTELMKCAENGDLENAKYYISDAGASDSFGKTALMRAAERGNPEMVQFLISYENHMQDIDGWTALMFAVHSRNEECVRILEPYEGRMQLDSGQTAMMMASFWNNPAAVAILIQKEACAQTTDMYFEGKGFTALMEAARWGRSDIVRLLLPHEGHLLDNSGKSALDYARISAHSVSHADREECISILSGLSA